MIQISDHEHSYRTHRVSVNDYSCFSGSSGCCEHGVKTSPVRSMNKGVFQCLYLFQTVTPSFDERIFFELFGIGTRNVFPAVFFWRERIAQHVKTASNYDGQD